MGRGPCPAAACPEEGSVPVPSAGPGARGAGVGMRVSTVPEWRRLGELSPPWAAVWPSVLGEGQAGVGLEGSQHRDSPSKPGAVWPPGQAESEGSREEKSGHGECGAGQPGQNVPGGAGGLVGREKHGSAAEAGVRPAEAESASPPLEGAFLYEVGSLFEVEEN